MSATVLDREMYTEAAAARLLRVPLATLHYWLEGGRKGGRTYQPILRERRTRTNVVTWAEFIEAGLLREYRRDLQTPMVELRAFINSLRDEMGVPYPLAHYRPYASGKKLLVKAQENAQLGAEFALVAAVGGQYVLSPAADQFFQRITWADDMAQAWRPTDDRDSPVIVDPDVRFGRPSIGGISTETIWELLDGGEDEDDLADQYGLSRQQIQWAMSYELAARAA